MSQFSGARNISIHNSTFHAHQVQNRKGGFERLQEHVAHGAFHDSGECFDPPKCYPNTRVAIIKRITNWIHGLTEDNREALIMWLYGAAGAGKSAIAQTIAEILDGHNFVLSSFFFSRNDPQRGTAKFLVTTLAYQLAVKLPHVVRDRMGLAFENDPLITTRSFEAQFKALIREPLVELFYSGFSTNNPIVVIIDGLDECNDSRAQAKIVDLAFTFVRSRDIPMKIIVASRPEMDISTSFMAKPSSSLARVALNDNYQSEDDIRRFLTEIFGEIKTQHQLGAHIPESWPSPDTLDLLVERSSGQFIYASTVAKYVASPRHRPTHRLEIVLGIRSLKGDNDSPFGDLDALYRHILMGAEDVNLVLKTFGFVLFPPPSYYGLTSVALVEFFFSLHAGDIQLLMQNLGSLVSLTKPSLHDVARIDILHGSLKDYLVDQSRSKDLFLDLPKMHACYAELCFAHINMVPQNPEFYMEVLVRFFYHCPLAESTSQLLTDIPSLSLSRCLTLYPNESSGYIVSKYFSYLSKLKSNWENFEIYRFVADEVFALQQVIKSQLDPGHPYLHVSFFLAHILLNVENPERIDRAGPYPYYDFFFLRKMLENPKLFTIYSLLAGYIMCFSDVVIDAFIVNLQEWITSSRRPVDAPSIYASAALFSLRLIATNFPYAIGFPLRSLRYLRTRTHHPAQSRWYIRSIYPWYRRSIYPWYRRHVYHFYSEGYETMQRYQRFVAGKTHFLNLAFQRRRFEVIHIDSFHYAKSVLPEFLGRSGHSEELITYARHARLRRKNRFPKLIYPDWGHADRRPVLRALKAYLRRVEGGD